MSETENPLELVSLAPRPSPAAPWTEPETGLQETPPVPWPEAPEVPTPDPQAVREARAAVDADGRLGRLGEFVVWAAGARGSWPPASFAAPVAVVIAGRHAVAGYIGRHREGAVDVRLDDLRASWSDSDGARLVVLDLAASGLPAAGRIDRVDAMSRPDTVIALSAGRDLVDREVDAGADLIVVGDVDAESGPAAAALISVLTDREPVACVARGGDVGVWARTVETVRDARRRGTPYAADPLMVLTAIGGPDLAALTGVLIQAAVRRTPVLIDGVAAAACGLVAEVWAPDCSIWWCAAGRSGDPAQALALTALDLTPLIDLGIGWDCAATGILALPLLRAAIERCG